MSDKPAEGTVTPSSALSGVTEEQLQQMIQKVVMGITKEAIPRMVQKSIEGVIPSLLEKMNGGQTEQPAATQAASNPADGETKLTLKALQEQIAKLNQGIQERDRKVQDAEQRARDVRLRSEVQSQFAKHLGADSPHLGPYVNQYMSQFADHDGQTMRKVKNDYGEDVFVPAGQAVEEMFKGELKHLVQNSKAPNLPRAQSFQQLTGNPFVQPQLNNDQQEMNPILGEFARHFAQQGDIGKANALISSQPAPAPKK